MRPRHSNSVNRGFSSIESRVPVLTPASNLYRIFIFSPLPALVTELFLTKRGFCPPVKPSHRRLKIYRNYGIFLVFERFTGGIGPSN